MPDIVRLVREQLDVASLTATTDSDGALALFIGVVRNENAGRRVTHLEYEAYEEMALPLMEEITKDVRRQFPVSQIRLVHRLGRLEVGEVSVVVAVSSPHRSEAFSACRLVIDTLKSKVPIWKKEFSEDGASWIEGHCTPATHRWSERDQPPSWNIERVRVKTPSSSR